MGTLNEDLSAIKTVEDTIIANKVAKFAYTDEAYDQNDANGVTEYNVNNAQNIPTADASVLKVNETVLSKGYRSQASSITRMLVNHFFGRMSYNLNKVNDNVSNLIATLIAHRGTANGFATLDANGSVPYSQLPVSYEDVTAKTPRWLRFDFTAGNNQTLKIVADTHIRVGNTVVHFFTDTSFDLSGTINTATSPNGKDWYVFLDTEGHVTCSLSKVEASGTRRIGQFHTLCVDAGARVTGIVPTELTQTGGDFLIKQYDKEEDPDFYAFYNKPITAITSGDYYNVGTVDHPLSGFEANDILPESIWCLTFHPACSSYDGMIYDRDCDIAVDIYLQSGKGKATRSAFGATHTVSRQQMNHEEDMRAVGKRLLKDHEFTSIASGSNERTTITGASDKTTVGGNVDTKRRRMISFIGCEECCGYLAQWLEEICGADSVSGFVNNDGQGSFGQQFWNSYSLFAGGNWNNSNHCGSRSRNAANIRSYVSTDVGCRGSAGIIRVA